MSKCQFRNKRWLLCSKTIRKKLRQGSGIASSGDVDRGRNEEQVFYIFCLFIAPIA